MADSDDDAPPPLSSLAEQVDALKLRHAGGESSSGLDGLPNEEALRVANVVLKPVSESSKHASASTAPALRKGFFDAAPKRRPKPPAEQKKPEPPVEEIPMIRAKKNLGDGPVIPDFLRVEPDEQTKQYAAMKADLLEKLRPTPDTVAQIGQNPGLLAAFEDPEVMAAVNDIAANPQNIKKYKDNAKVAAFYGAMGKLMGQKLDAMGQSTGPGRPTR